MGSKTQVLAPKTLGLGFLDLVHKAFASKKKETQGTLVFGTQNLWTRLAKKSETLDIFNMMTTQPKMLGKTENLGSKTLRPWTFGHCSGIS